MAAIKTRKTSGFYEFKIVYTEKNVLLSKGE